MQAPSSSQSFDAAYRAPFTFWGDIRVPDEIRALAWQLGHGRTVLELGCGLGRLSRFMASQGLQATGVDFSPVAIGRAAERVARDEHKPSLLVADVTHLGEIGGPFDAAFDVGCFQCLDDDGQARYVQEVSRRLRPGASLLVWALDRTPAGQALTPRAAAERFAPGFELSTAHASRRRIARSHWYWLRRR